MQLTAGKGRRVIVGRHCERRHATLLTSSMKYFVSVPSIQASLTTVSHGITQCRSMEHCDREYPGVGRLAAVVTTDKARWGVVGRRCKKQRATISTSSTTFFVGVPSIQASMVKVSHGSTGWRSSGPCGREYLSVGCLAAVVTANKARWDVVSRRCKR